MGKPVVFRLARASSVYGRQANNIFTGGFKTGNHYKGAAPNPKLYTAQNPKPYATLNPKPYTILNPKPYATLNPKPYTILNPKPYATLNPKPVGALLLRCEESTR